MHILWLDNSDTDDKFVFSEAYGDDRNSPYTIIDRVRIDEIITDASGLRSYKLPQEEADRIERLLRSGDNSDIDYGDNSSNMKNSPMRIRLMNLLNVCLSAPGRGVQQYTYSCFDLLLDMLRILFASSKWVHRINGLGHVFVINNYELLKFNWKCSNDITEITGT